MGRPFSDITLYAGPAIGPDSQEYKDEVSLMNYISDLYVINMEGYKPPKATRVCIQPFYHKIWKGTSKFGSIISIAPEFDNEKWITLERREKYRYVLDIIQKSMLQLSNEYNWDKTVFKGPTIK